MYGPFLISDYYILVILFSDVVLHTTLIFDTILIQIPNKTMSKIKTPMRNQRARRVRDFSKDQQLTVAFILRNVLLKVT